MIKSLVMLLLITGVANAVYVSKKQFLNILDYDISTKEVMSKYPEHTEFKKFTKYLFGIYFQESSLGLYSYSDTEEDKIYYLQNNKKVFISKDKFHQAKLFNDGGKYIEVKLWGKYWKKRLHVISGQLKPVIEASIGPNMFRVSTARYMIKYYDMKQYHNLLTDDKAIVNKLLNDLNFTVYLTYMYLKYNYDIAIKRGYDQPLLRAVGRHNGGWNNWKYVGKVTNAMRLINETVVENRYKINFNDYLKSKQEYIK